MVLVCALHGFDDTVRTRIDDRRYLHSSRRKQATRDPLREKLAAIMAVKRTTIARKPRPGTQTASTGKSAGKEGKALQQVSRLAQVLEVVLTTAQAKGWEAEVVSRDEVMNRYASVEVSKLHADFQTIEATVEISLEDDTVRFPIHPGDKFRTTGLGDLHTSIAAAIRTLSWIQKRPAPAIPLAALNELVLILRRFHSVARQIRSRHDNRTTLDVVDEYDVQDLLHALLRSRFDDVRPEEAAPSHAGANSRIDFLLKKEKIALEVKMTRSTLRDKQIGEELLVDIARYKGHPDCESLVCLVYDPSGYVVNSSGLENDLSGDKNGVKVRVVVCPIH